jgi:hypothetical protein
MSRLVARLVLAMLLLPLSGSLVVGAFAVIVGTGGPPRPVHLLIMWIFVYAFIAVYWALLWRDTVRWTRSRRFRTMLWAPLSLAAGAMFGLCVLVFTREKSVAVLFGGGIPPIVWVLATVLIWRETPQERIERIARAGRDTIACPICGYNMTGLNEARCPECGTRFTLDQLLAGQPQREAAALHEE